MFVSNQESACLILVIDYSYNCLVSAWARSGEVLVPCTSRKGYTVEAEDGGQLLPEVASELAKEVIPFSSSMTLARYSGQRVIGGMVSNT
jgi:hypothetical protein